MKKSYSNKISYYKILGLNETDHTSDMDIKRAYYSMARRYHPDQNKTEKRIAEMRFQLINEAYDNLKTQDRRVNYNRFLRTSRGGGGGRPLSKSSSAMAGNDNKNRVSTNSKGHGWLDKVSAWITGAPASKNTKTNNKK